MNIDIINENNPSVQCECLTDLKGSPFHESVEFVLVIGGICLLVFNLFLFDLVLPHLLTQPLNLHRSITKNL